MKINSKLTMGIIAGLGLAAVACMGHILAQRAQTQALNHAALLGELNTTVALQVAESRQLLRNQEHLSRFQQRHDKAIVQFQQLMDGQLKEGLTDLPALLSKDPQPLQNRFEAYAAQVAGIIRKRAQLTRLVDDHKTLEIESRNLARKATALAEGLQQINAGSGPVSQGFHVALSLQNHQRQVEMVLSDQGSYPELPLDQLEPLLTALSKGDRAPASAVIRRSAANLLNALQAFSDQEDKLVAHSRLRDTMLAELETLQQQQLALAQELANWQDRLSHYTHWGSQWGPLFWVCSLGLVIGLLWQTLRKGTITKPAQQPPAAQPPAREITESPFVGQLKMEKNKLAADIKALSEGILYMEADEHADYTSELARSVNQLRQSLLQRLNRLQVLFNALDQVCRQRTPAYHAQPATPDSRPMEDLSFRIQGEIEGINRKLRAMASAESERLQDLLGHCQRADTMLDEVRVRARKAGDDQPRAVLQSGEESQEDASAETIAELLESLQAWLAQWKTEPPPSKRRPARISEPHSGACDPAF